jgi:hypothetical protein
MVDVLLEARRGDTQTDDPTQTHDLTIIAEKPPERMGSLRLKRYINA